MKATLIPALAVVLLYAAWPVLAAPRTTPTTVENSPTIKVDSTENTVKIDPTINVVRSAQNGVWIVGVNSLPTVNVSTHAVSQYGTWNVGLTGNPAVSQHGPWNVGILSTANTVKTPTQRSTMQLWASDTSLAPSTILQSPHIDCSGFKELRLTLVCGSTPDPSAILLGIRFLSPNGVWVYAGGGNFGLPTIPIATQGNFHGTARTFMLNIPVMSDTAYVYVHNGSDANVTIENHSWAYLVN